MGAEVGRLEFSFMPTGVIFEMLGILFAFYGFKKFALREQVNRAAFIKRGHLLAVGGN